MILKGSRPCVPLNWIVESQVKRLRVSHIESPQYAVFKLDGKSIRLFLEVCTSDVTRWRGTRGELLVNISTLGTKRDSESKKTGQCVHAINERYTATRSSRPRVSMHDDAQSIGFARLPCDGERCSILPVPGIVFTWGNPTPALAILPCIRIAATNINTVAQQEPGG